MSRFELGSKIIIPFISVLKFVIIFSAQQDYGVDFERSEIIPGTTRTLFTFSAKNDRNDKREVCSIGKMTYFEDFGHDFKISIAIAVSTYGQNNFVASPLRIPPKDYCEFVNTTWRDFIEPTLPEIVIPPEGLCPFPKGYYEVKCFKIVVTDKWPSHVPKGLWRLTIKYTKNDEFVGGILYYANIYSIK